jgi:para-aminobenzoate synthetase component I
LEVILNNTRYSSPLDQLICSIGDSKVFEKLDVFLKKNNGNHIICFFSYELKNHIEKLESSNIDNINFPLLICFTPEEIEENYTLFTFEKEEQQNIYFQPRETKASYIETINQVKNHIQKGDFYETNYCYEWWTECLNFRSKQVYKKLISITNPPYKVYADLKDHQILSASPELFIQKRGNKLISKPIKGTQRRSKIPEDDNSLVKALKNNPKERAENIMIVDLVRNDFSKIATANSVKVEELCEIYSFKNIHQMISTVSCEIKNSTSLISILKATFPMGSMTGAPKIEVLKTMEKLEKTQRGLYSGSIGVIKPNGDFDFNVIIRTLLYNKRNNILSFHVGGAITNQSDPEKEYEETLIKAQALFEACR